MRFIKHVVYTLIPTVCAYLASSNFAFDYLIERGILAETINVELAQDILLGINIVFTVAVLGIQLIWYDIRLDRKQKQMEGLCRVIKDIVKQTFRNISKNDTFEFDMRIFVPKNKLQYWLKHKLIGDKAELYYEIKNHAPFAQRDTTEYLSLRVLPEPQGLVGACYKEKAVVFDENLKANNATAWKLSEVQVSRTSNLLWSMCVPIVNNNNDVVAIVAFDSSTSPLKIEKNREDLAKLTNTLAILLHDNIPELF